MPKKIEGEALLPINSPENLSAEPRPEKLDYTDMDRAELIARADDEIIKLEDLKNRRVEEAGIVDKAKFKLIKIFGSRELYEKAFVDFCRGGCESDINRLESGLGRSVVEKKQSLEKHKISAEHDLGVLAKYKDVDLTTYQEQYDEERQEMESQKNKDEEKLNSKLAERKEGLPEKQNEMREILEGSRDLYDAVLGQRKNLEGKLREAKNDLKSLKIDNPRYEKDFSAIIKDLEGQLFETKKREDGIKSRLDIFKKSKKAIDDRLNRLDAIGKTKEEIRLQKEEETKKTGQRTESKKSTAEDPQIIYEENKYMGPRDTERGASEEKEKPLLEKDKDEWIKIFSQEFRSLYDLYTKSNIKDALDDIFKKRGLGGQLNSNEVAPCAVELLVQNTSKYFCDRLRAKNRVEEMIYALES